LERLAPESGALLVKVYMARKEWPRALARCQRLLPVAVNDNFQAELLFDMMKIQRALGLPQAAAGTLARLLKEHPYSEAAAHAKELKK
jgi:outer membrane protein assembly factor BamD (BamD/ComL family)